MRFCRSCDDPIDADEFNKARRRGNLPEETSEYPMADYCFTCFCELAGKQTPMVTDSNLAPPGTGLTPRQRYGKRHTDGG
jgi:hypothetical protein